MLGLGLCFVFLIGGVMQENYMLYLAAGLFYIGWTIFNYNKK